MAVWWIVLAVVVAGLLVLVLAVVAVLRRLPRLGRAAVTLRRHQAQALGLRESAEQLQERLLTMQAQAEEAERRIAIITAKTDK
jgi:hypothetical protein